MKPPKKNLHFNGGKMFHINNKNLLYMNGYTYVVMLTVTRNEKNHYINFVV
jgi:hypothetical protein